MSILYDSLRCYKQIELTHENKIKYFLEQHSTKEGTWGQLILNSGAIDFIFLNGEGQELSKVSLDNTNKQIKFPPACLHKIVQNSKEFSATLKFYCMPHRYFNKKHKLGHIHSDLLYISNNYLKNAGKLNVLDIGCGSGRNIFHYAAEGHHVMGVDINSKALESINAIAIQEKINNIKTRVHDLNNSLELNDEMFDLIVATVSLQFLNAERIPVLLKEMQQHTRAKGLHFLVFPIDSPEFNLPESFTYLPQKDEIYHYYQDAGWGVLEYNEKVGNLHRLDELGKPIQGKFGLILAQKH
tara:strand:- start:29159 stop:30052 length:894 start_codon:yes stop_codon:yes gene_type:complete